jgi:hypothetical protein
MGISLLKLKVFFGKKSKLSTKPGTTALVCKSCVILHQINKVTNIESPIF